MYGNGRPGADRERREHGEDACRGTWRRARRARTPRPPRPAARRRRLSAARAAARRARRSGARRARACACRRGRAPREGSSSPAVRGRVGRVAHGFEQLGHAHHAELVEVGREDRDEAQPLEQRDALVAGQLEHARVPLEPRQLAVEEARLLRGLLRGGGRPSALLRRSVRAHGGAGTSAARRAGRRSARLPPPRPWETTRARP